MALTDPDPKWPHGERIGNQECPILYRWTLAGYRPPKDKTPSFKLFLHHFFPKSDDRDVHDHPCAFFTFCFFGSYEDLSLCDICAGNGYIETTTLAPRFRRPLTGLLIGPDQRRLSRHRCARCGGDGVIANDRVRFGSFRYRPAEHTHRTKSGRFGAWTLVLMLPKSRKWGFWRNGRWWTAAEYEDAFGPAMRCD